MDLSYNRPILSLSEDEFNILPWQQMINNGAIRPESLVIEDPVDDDKNGDVEEPEEYFSDGERSASDELYDTPELELRNYQKELAEIALGGKNTIICAPTGSGKTRVATYIISNHLKTSDDIEKKVAFLARTVPLAEQQYKSLCKYLPNYQIMLITGERQNNMSLHLLLPHNDIVVMTPMILENHITRKLLSDLGVFSLIVFDECHHTRKGEPYNTLMSFYHKSRHMIHEAATMGRMLNISLPQIIGLTASIGVEGADSLAVAKINILKICANLDVSEISTVETYKDELLEVVPVPTEKERRLYERRDDAAVERIIHIMEVLEGHMRNYIRELNNAELNALISARPVNKKFQDYEQWAVKMMDTAKVVPISSTDGEKSVFVRLIVNIARYLIGYRSALETYDLVELKDVMDYLHKCFWDLQAHEKRTQEENSFYDHFVDLRTFVLQEHIESNPNLQVLADILIQFLVNNGNTSRGIIFVRTRALAEALSSWLNRCEIEDLRNLNAHPFTGSNVSETQGGTSQARQEYIIQQFKSGDVRVIVATSVAEEGIDIAECNLVVKYNHVGNEVSTVQMRGRSRAFNGVSFLLAMHSVLEREHDNRIRAELMNEAIKSIKRMTAKEFKSAVSVHQQELLTLALAAEQAEIDRRQTLANVQFKIICPMCRKVSVENTSMRTIYGKYRISIDRNLLNQIILRPLSEPEPMDGLHFVGLVRCKGEIRPGEICFHPLGYMIKHKGVPFVSVGIKKIAFVIGNQDKPQSFKKWKKVRLIIEELTYDDIKRYITESTTLGPVLTRNGNGDQAEDEQSDDENSSSDSENEF